MKTRTKRKPKATDGLTRRLSIRVSNEGHRAIKAAATERDTFIQSLATELIYRGIDREDLIPERAARN